MTAAELVAAKHDAERAIDDAARLEREGELRRALDRRMDTASALLERVSPELRRQIGEAMRLAFSELSRAPRSDTGAVLAASAKIEAALRAVVAAGASPAPMAARSAT